MLVGAQGRICGTIGGCACDVYFHCLPAGDAHTVSLCEEAEASFRKGSDMKAAGVRKRLKEEYGLSDEELDPVTTPGVQQYLGMLWIGALLYPQYADYDLQEEVAEYYRLFYGCHLTSQMYRDLTENAPQNASDY